MSLRRSVALFFRPLKQALCRHKHTRPEYKRDADGWLWQGDRCYTRLGCWRLINHRRLTLNECHSLANAMNDPGNFVTFKRWLPFGKAAFGEIPPMATHGGIPIEEAAAKSNVKIIYINGQPVEIPTDTFLRKKP